MPPNERHQVQVLLSMRGTPSRLAHGGPAEPRDVPVEPSASRNVETRSPTRVEETVPQTTQATPSGAQTAQTATPNVPMRQATSSSSAIVSSGGEHAKRSADPPVEGRFRCLKSRNQEDVQSHTFCQCPVSWSTRKDAVDAGEMVTITTHNANVELPIEQQLHLTEEVKTNVELKTVQPVHLTWEGAISIQTTSPAASGAATSSQVGGVSNQIQVATHAGVQAKSGPTAVHAGTANEEIQLRAGHVGAAACQGGAAMKHSCKLLIKTWPMLKRTMTWLTYRSWNTHFLTKMKNTWSENTPKRCISMKTMERLWIQCRSGPVSSARWRSWENSVLMMQPSEDGKGVVNTVMLPKEG